MRLAASVCALFCTVTIAAGLFPPQLLYKTVASSTRWVKAGNKKVQIALPFRGSAFFAPVLPAYLYVTQSTASVAAVSASDFEYIPYSHTLLPKVFPDLFNIDTATISRGANPASNIEAMLQRRPGAIFAFAASYAQPLERVGLPVVPIVNVPSNPEQSVLEQAKTYQEVTGLQ